MSQPLLSIAAACQDHDPCRFTGEDLFLDIRVRNDQPVAVGFPLAFIQKTGPVIRLIDVRTKAETFLPKNLADLALRDRFTAIPPGGSVGIAWVISADELRQFEGERVDVFAEITIATQVRVADRAIDFTGTTTLRIADGLAQG